MAEKIATRAAYGKALVELADQEPNLVVLDADLSGSTMTKEFAAAHPDRFFDMGIAEANMVGVAAGLATCGKKPFVNSFAMFAAGRAWEQVRNSVAYPGLNVKVVGSHGGLSVGEDGATHQCIEDLAIMRAIPNMTVLCPCDGYEMREAVRALLAYEGPAYMRLGRLAVETVDECVARVVEATSRMGGITLITADHGNADRMLEDDGVTPYTAHTTNPVPFYIVGADVKLRDGILADIAPTMLDVMGLACPPEMDGQTLIVK